jgi:transketolase
MALAERISTRASATTSSTTAPMCSLRRRPDGRHQPGGDRARRPSEAQQADRAVRRQRHLHRRADVAVDSGRPVARFKAAGWNASRVDGHDPDAIAARHRRAARKSDKPTLIACQAPSSASARRPRPAPRKVARLAARRRGDQGRAREARLDASAVRDPDDILAPGARPGSAARRRARPGSKRSRARRAARRVRAAHGRQAAGGLTDARRRAEGEARRREAEARDAQGVAELALEALVPAVPEMIGGSADLTGSNNTKTKADARLRPAISPAATSTTASASTAWPRR